MITEIKTNQDLVNKIIALKLNIRNIPLILRTSGWNEIYSMTKDPVLLQKISMISTYIDAQIPFLFYVPDWATEGKDYMIIPNGTVFRVKDTTQLSLYFSQVSPADRTYNYWAKMGPISIYDYDTAGLLDIPQKKAEWNDGAGMIYDGQYLLLTCNSLLFEKTKEHIRAKTTNIPNPFFHTHQYSCFANWGMEEQFISVICNSNRDPEAYKRTLYYEFFKAYGVPPIWVPSFRDSLYITSGPELLAKLAEYDQEHGITMPKTYDAAPKTAQSGMPIDWIAKMHDPRANN